MESDTMNMRDQIMNIIGDELYENRGDVYGAAAAADAILAAMPDMIAPLVWDRTANNHWESGHYSINEKRGVFRVSFWAGGSIGLVKVCTHNEFDSSVLRANTHHRAAIMAAFTGETK
jgi:hypothetical protein